MARVDLAQIGPGLAWAYEFDENGVGRPLPIDKSFDLMHGRRFIWAHAILSNARTRDWVEAQTCVPDEAKDSLLSSDAHPRTDAHADALFGVLFDAKRELDAASNEAGDFRFVLRPQFLVTARHHPVFSASAVKSRIDEGATFESSAALFEQLLVTVADSVGAAAHRISQEIDGIEDRVLSETLSDETGKLLKLRRSISRQERLVHGAMSALGQLEQHAGRDALEAYVSLGRRVRQRISSFHSDLHLQGERARLLQEETAAQLATATNRNLFVLTVVTTVLLPPAFVTGYFGMNTKNLLFSESDYGTLYATVLCLFAALVVYFLIRRYRMLA